MSEKTKQPTPRKLRQAREKGQLPRSRLLASAATVAGGLGGLSISGPRAIERLRGWTVTVLSGGSLESPQAALDQALSTAAWCVLPTLVGALLGALAAGVLVAGFAPNPNLVTPKLERIDPFAGLRRLFSPRQLVEVGKGLAVMVILGVVFWSAVRSGAPDALASVRFEGELPLVLALHPVGALVRRCVLLLIAFGVVDYFLARRRHRRELMMTREECVREHKESEGDPHHKAMRKSLHRQLAMGGPARGVQKATAVVVNPTHIAVALRYDEGECEAPYVVAKAREEDALKLRRQAERSGIPVVRDVPLARALVHFEVGEQVPEELYYAVAAVLRVALESQNADVGPKAETV